MACAQTQSLLGGTIPDAMKVAGSKIASQSPDREASMSNAMKVAVVRSEGNDASESQIAETEGSAVTSAATAPTICLAPAPQHQLTPMAGKGSDQSLTSPAISVVNVVVNNNINNSSTEQNNDDINSASRLPPGGNQGMGYET